MTKKETADLKAKAAEWGKDFPSGTKVAVVLDDGVRKIAEIDGEAKVVDGTLIVFVLFDTDRGRVSAQVKTNRVRPRAIERRKMTIPLRVELTVDERLEAADAMVDAAGVIHSRESDLEQAKKQIGADIKAAEAIVEAKAGLLRAGYEVRPVACEQITDFDLGIVREIKVDSGEVVRERPITPDERQREIALFPDMDAGKVPLKLVKGVQDESGTAGGAIDQGKAPDSPRDPLATPDDALIAKAIAILKETGRASTSAMQRRLKIGYAMATRVMDALEEKGIVGPPNGAEPREILADLDADPSKG